MTKTYRTIQISLSLRMPDMNIDGHIHQSRRISKDDSH